jgi:hypothetical protein
MNYFAIKDDLEHMRALLHHYERIVEIEQRTRENLEDRNYLTMHSFLKDLRAKAAKSEPEYKDLRTAYAKMIPRANEICEREKVSWHRQGWEAQIEGGAAFQGSIFAFVLDRPSDLMDIDTDVHNTINQVVGILEYKEAQEYRKLRNPRYWLTQAFIFVVRLPYTILKISGFDVNKIQDHLFARLFQLIYVIALILLLTWFGLASVIDLKSILVP